MPLDRVIQLERDEGDFNSSGEYEYDWQMIGGSPVWAQQNSAGSSDVETGAGVLVQAARNYTIRWRADLFDISPAKLRIVDDLGHIWNVDGVSESDNRRRVIGIQCIREVTE